MPGTAHTDRADSTDLAIAIEEYYAGMVESHHTTYEALQLMAQTYSKQTPQLTAYSNIASALYTARPQVAEDSAAMRAYLSGINELCVVWATTDPQFNEARFLDLAAIERRDGILVLLPF